MKFIQSQTNCESTSELPTHLLFTNSLLLQTNLPSRTAYIQQRRDDSMFAQRVS